MYFRYRPDKHNEQDIDRFFSELKKRLLSSKKAVTVMVVNERRREKERLVWKLIGDLAERLGYSREEMKKILIMQTDGIELSRKMKCSINELDSHEFDLFFDYVVFIHQKEFDSLRKADF